MATGSYPTPPPPPECPICVLPLPLEKKESTYMDCCGKTICAGCTYESSKAAMDTRGEDFSCAFCRQPGHDGNAEYIARLKKRVESNDDHGMYQLAVAYRDGDGVPRNPRKEVDLLLRSAELGNSAAAHNLSVYYRQGKPDAGVEASEKKHREYLELAAYRGGDDRAWYNLGVVYMMEGNAEAGMYHFRMAASYGDDDSLESVKSGYRDGCVKKEDLASTLRAWKVAQDNMKSEGRRQAKLYQAKLYDM